MSVHGLTVVVAGASSASGNACTHALAAAGARVIAVGSNAQRLAPLAAHDSSIQLEVCDLGSLAETTALAARLREQHGSVDGLIHLVGGWRGASGIASQSDDDWSAMEAGFSTLRNTTRAFYDALTSSDDARLAIVSSSSVDKPTPGGASYAAAKAAAESWVRSVAAGFTKDAKPEVPRAAAVRFVIRAFVSPEQRAEHPEKPFTGFTDTEEFAAAVTGLWDTPAHELNDARISLIPTA